MISMLVRTLAGTGVVVIAGLTAVGVALTAPSCVSVAPAQPSSQPSTSSVPNAPFRSLSATPSVPRLTMSPGVPRSTVSPALAAASSCGSAVPAMGVAGLGVSLAGLVGLLAFGPSRRTPPVLASPAEPGLPALSPAPAPVVDPVTAQHRTRLIDTLVELLPELSEGLALRDVAALEAVGAVRVSPVPGEVFDPRLHAAAGVEPTDRADLAGRVARTLRPGFVDAGRVVGFAHVTVFSGPAPSSGPASPADAA
jgi:hypothetical protein